MASQGDMYGGEHWAGSWWGTCVGNLYAGGVAAAVGDVVLGGRLVGHAAAEQLAHGAGHARHTRLAARQPARLLIVRLQQHTHFTPTELRQRQMLPTMLSKIRLKAC